MSTQRANFDWRPQPEAARFIRQIVDGFCNRSDKLASFREQLLQRTATRLIDWLDHITLSELEPTIGQLAKVGFEPESAVEAGKISWRNKAGLFPVVRVGGDVSGLAIRVDSIDDFLAATGRVTGETLPFNWPPPGPYRKVQSFLDHGIELCAVERHGTAGFAAQRVTPAKIELVAEHLAAFRARKRKSLDCQEGFDDARAKFNFAADALGIGWACDLFFQSEREFWQSRNKAARTQYARQQRLGLGWGNHDHHTYRCSRRWFAPLIALLEIMGFTCRERFYAGDQAGWGAQVLQHAACGLVVFADVDLSPDEVASDFAHQPMPDRKELGTVGLWCRLHGESLLAAGMHHLECQFDFDNARTQLATAGIDTMAPFTHLPYLKQAFTVAERWKVAEERVHALVADQLITAEEAGVFRAQGALGSHLEILQRDDGYKGFNQSGISDIIRRTDPRG